MLDVVALSPSPKAPRRSFSPLGLVGLLILCLFIGQWLWLTRLPTTLAAQPSLPPERAPLLTTLLAQRAIVWSMALSLMTMLLALLLALSPIGWWLRMWARLGITPKARALRVALHKQEEQSAEEWVAEQAALLQAIEAQAPPNGVPDPAAPSADPTGTAVAQPTAAAEAQNTGGQPAQGQQGVGQPAPGQSPSAPGAAPGQPAPSGAVQPPGATPGQPAQGQQPGTQQAQPPQQPAAAPPPAPGAPQPAAPAPAQQGLQQLLAPNENVDLKELTDIGDILNSFKDNDEVSAALLALSQSLDDVAIKPLATKCRQVAKELIRSNALATRL